MKLIVVLFVVLFATLVVVEAGKKCNRCPRCGNPPYSNDDTCSCGRNSVRIFARYACGPACDAAGYCCDRNTPNS